MAKLQYIIIGVFFSSFSGVLAGPVVLTGDSITVDYAPLVPGAMTEALGGLTAESYLGLCCGQTTNFAQSVVDLDPDTIVFMLGANDSANNTSTATRFNFFMTHVDTAFDLFDGSTASRVIVLSILPVDETAMTMAFGANIGPGMNARVNTDYNPWLQAEVAARPKFEYLDVNTLIQMEANWPGGLLSTDGLHLTAAGSQWLADQVIGATAVPEPSAFLLLGLIGVGVCTANVRRKNWLCRAQPPITSSKPT